MQAGPPQEARQERALPTDPPVACISSATRSPAQLRLGRQLRARATAALGFPHPPAAMEAQDKRSGLAIQAVGSALGAVERSAASSSSEVGGTPVGASARVLAAQLGCAVGLDAGWGGGRPRRRSHAGMARHPHPRSPPQLPLAPPAGRARVLDLPRQPGAAHLPLQVPSVSCRRRRRVRAQGPSGCTCGPRFECLRPAQPAPPVLCCRTAHPRCLARWQLQSAGSR